MSGPHRANLQVPRWGRELTVGFWDPSLESGRSVPDLKQAVPDRCVES